jgi:hypothetical protein
MRIAKTYESNNGWTSPISMSTFGIPILLPNNICEQYLGLEEFNFSNLMKKEKLAYLPCFSSENAGIIDAAVYDNIDLFYLEDATGITYHYATMKNVRRIEQGAIEGIRANLLAEGLPKVILNDEIFLQNYQESFAPAYKIWENNFSMNNIVAAGNLPRFVLNVNYSDLIIFDTKVARDWNNFTFASILYYYPESVE